MADPLTGIPPPRALAVLGAACVFLTHVFQSARSEIFAFPGALGQGAASSGGRGGDVYHVTNLSDYDSGAGEEKIPGSLRHAIRSAEGPRTIVFDVAGPIKLRSRLELLKSRITLAGQTSPGGITLWGFPFEISGASDVVIRYMRFRLGDFHVAKADGVGLDDTSDVRPLPPATANALDIGRCDRVILDHVSVSWGIDETLSVTKSRNVTVQHSIIAESLNDSYHPKGPHGYGSLIRGELTVFDRRNGTGGYTMFGNLWAHHRARNPSLGGQQSLDAGQRESDRRSTDVNLVNNVIYNWDDQAVHRSNLGKVRVNLVANYFVNGPLEADSCIFKEDNEAHTELYHEGNYHDDDRDAVLDGRLIAHSDSRAFCRFGDADVLLSAGVPLEFFGDLEQRLRPAPAAYELAIEAAGASLWRDPVDRRIIESLVARTGHLIDSQTEYIDASGHTPGIDDLPTARRPKDFDTDGDGMPDDFERASGLDPNDSSDRNQRDLNNDGYTNLEVYLDQAAHEP